MQNISAEMAAWTGPDFFVVGAAKAGTTAVWSWLRQHPDVFLPETVKEPGYFAFAARDAKPANGPYDPDYVARITTTPEAYGSLFEHAGWRTTGDVSPVYLCDTGAAERIAKARPDAKIIIILRDPVKRAFSQYMHHRRDGLEPLDTFDAAMDVEIRRQVEGWSWAHGYVHLGHYALQVQRYLAQFPRQNILFLEFDSLKTDPEDCWRKISDHIGLRTIALPTNGAVNTTFDLTGVPANPGLARALRHPGSAQRLLKRLMPKPLRRGLRKMLEGKPAPLPALSDEARARLRDHYAPERRWLQDRTGLDLSHWSS